VSTNNESTIRVTREGPVARVTLARPEVRNAFNPAMVGALTRAFEDLGQDNSVRVVVLAGDGPSFSAGADLAYMRSMALADESENLADTLRLADLFAAVHDCPKPVVVRVHGAAVGGGAGMVAAADIAVAAQGTRFAFSEVRLGIVSAVIAPYVVPRIGVAAARELILTGEMFDAERARSIGLVNRVVPESALDATVADLVAALLNGAPGAQAAVKRLLDVVAGEPRQFRQVTAELLAERRASAEGHEGIAAFLARRAPSWAAIITEARPDPEPPAANLTRSGNDTTESS
jgi:methylglutaconyl-CoA hydratase